jgi:glutathione synthase/RimK-type ligase-like ATP-grasp enzyme
LILVISHAADDHAAGVLQALGRLEHPAVLIDTAQFPESAWLTQRFESGWRQYEYCADGHRIDLSTCRAAWWRRPQPYTLHPHLASEALAFTYSECHEAIAGLWEALDLQWVNPPVRDEAAHHKPYQLAVASKVGLTIPRTLITNDPDTARRFIGELGPDRTVYKTFLASEQCWRETRIVRPEEMTILDRVRLAPVIFQEYVPAAADLRVTVLGDRMFAAAIQAAPGGYDIDYRMDMAGAHFEPTNLPTKTQERLRDLMKALGLVYGAVDLRRTPDGQDVFLEVNPAGEWLFVEERTGQPITDAMAELLAALDRH